MALPHYDSKLAHLTERFGITWSTLCTRQPKEVLSFLERAQKSGPIDQF